MDDIWGDIPKKLKDLQQKLLFLRKDDKFEIQNGDLGFASAPSNIALIKYWGKYPGKKQIPENSSISYTLSGFRSFTKVTALGRFFPEGEDFSSHKFSHKLILKDENEKIIHKDIPIKMVCFLNNILFPYAKEISISIESYNNFPTACGIASSASGYAALVGAIADLLQLEKHFTKDELDYWIAEWSRLGSGSATRSSLIKKNAIFVAWKLREENEEIFTETLSLNFHTNWNKIAHCVFVLNSEEKETSSSEGHQFAQSSPFHAIRTAGVNEKFNYMNKALVDFDFETVKQITEEDAFAMHAIMQTGTPPARYLNSDVSLLISTFIKYRFTTNMKAFWTLDAGPNVHFIYLKEEEHLLNQFFLKLKEVIKKDIKIYKNIPGKEHLIIGKESYSNETKGYFL